MRRRDQALKSIEEKDEIGWGSFWRGENYIYGTGCAERFSWARWLLTGHLERRRDEPCAGGERAASRRCGGGRRLRFRHTRTRAGFSRGSEAEEHEHTVVSAPQTTWDVHNHCQDCKHHTEWDRKLVVHLAQRNNLTWLVLGFYNFLFFKESL